MQLSKMTYNYIGTPFQATEGNKCIKAYLVVGKSLWVSLQETVLQSHRSLLSPGSGKLQHKNIVFISSTTQVYSATDAQSLLSHLIKYFPLYSFNNGQKCWKQDGTKSRLEALPDTPITLSGWNQNSLINFWLFVFVMACCLWHSQRKSALHTRVSLIYLFTSSYIYC